MDNNETKNIRDEMDIIINNETKSKSAERITNVVKNNNNKKPKQDKSYRVGNYLIKNTLGSGTFGKVKLGIYLPTQEKVAVKILEKSKMTEKDDQIRLEREFEMLSQFNHPNLIMVTEIFESDNNYYTVMDYCEGGELFNYIVKNKYLSEKESSFFYYQIISGLEYIHSLGIVHRDLKPENLLLTKDHILKIIDFGLSNYFKEGQIELLYTPCGSPCYASPEMVTGNNYDGIMIDIWSTGIILFAMLCGYLPFEDKNNDKLFKKIADCKIDYPDYLSTNAVDLLKKIIVPNPKKRITINEIKKHPFYLQGKELFDKEFTIQYLTDDVNNNDNNTKEKEKDDKSKNENNKKDNNNIDNKTESNKNITEDKKERLSDINLENKENYNSSNFADNCINANNNVNSINNNDTNKTINNNSNSNNSNKNNISMNNNNSNFNNISNNLSGSIINKISSNLSNKLSNKISNNISKNISKNISNNISDNIINNISNNNYSNNNIIKNNISYNSILNKNNDNSKKDIIVNEKVDENNNVNEKNKKINDIQNTKDESLKKIINNDVDIYKTINDLDKRTIEVSEERLKIDNIYEQNYQGFYKPKTKLKNKIKKDNKNNNYHKKHNNNKKLLVNSFNKINIEGITNSKTIETINNSNSNNKEKNININYTDNNIDNNNINSNTIENDKNNNKKNNKINDNFLIITDLNDSTDVQKIKSINNISQNFCSNNNINSTKSKENKTINDEKYCSNTYNTNKNKTKKGNKPFNNGLGKILQINVVEKSKEKKEKENFNIKDITKKNEEDFNHKLFSITNTYYEGESKMFQKQKLKLKSKERKTEKNNSKKIKFNPKAKFLILNPYNYHKLTMSTDIKNNHTQVDLRAKKNISKNHDINIFDINRGNKSGRQDFCLTSTKKVVPGTKYYSDNLKINSGSKNKKNKNNNILSNNKLNNDFQEYSIKTETNEILHTDVGVNSLEINSKPKFKMNNNLFKMESKLSCNDTNKILKNTLYKNQNAAIYSSNNLKHLRNNNGIIIKSICQNILNEERLTSNRKKNFKRKFNNLSNNNNNVHNSENKTKKFNKIFTQKKINDLSNISNLTNITNSYSSKLKSDLIFKSNFVNYNNNINNSKEKKNITSKTNSLKNEKILSFSNKLPLCFLDDYTSSIDSEQKNNNNNNNNNNIYNTNTVQAIKKMNINNLNNINQAPGKFIRQIKKNNNYIHIKKKQLVIGNDKRNKSKSIPKYNNRQKSISTDDPSNLKDSKLSNNLNTMRNPFHCINKTINFNKKYINKQKINLKKNNITDENSSNTNSANPLVNIRNTFISFHMYPKYYLDPKKQLSTPKIAMTSPLNLKHSKKLNSNLKINSKTKFAPLTINNHLSPGIESPLKKYDINNFMNIQQNIYNNIDNQKLFYYTNTEYNNDTALSKNINLNAIKNMKNKILNRKYKTIEREKSSNNKMNSLNGNTNINFNNNKNTSNTISPTNNKRFNNKINININNIDNKNIAEYNKNNTNSDKISTSTNTIPINTNINENSNKNKNCLTRYTMSCENELNFKKKDIKLIEPSHDFNYVKKPNLTNIAEKGNCITTVNKNSSLKYGIKYKSNRKKLNP